MKEKKLQELNCKWDGISVEVGETGEVERYISLIFALNSGCSLSGEGKGIEEKK